MRPSHVSTPPITTVGAARQTGDDDAKEGDNASDDCLYDAAYATDEEHKNATHSLEGRCKFVKRTKR